MFGKTRYQWKGKVVSEKVYKLRFSQHQTGKGKLKKSQAQTEVEETHAQGKIDEIEMQAETEDTESKESRQRLIKNIPISPGEGRRIVDLIIMGKQLWCVSCKECLSLENIEDEHRRGLGSILHIRCHKCLLVNQIITGKVHSAEKSKKRNSRFDVNSKMVLGLMHSGIGFSNLNKLLSCLNIPTIDFKTYKRYEEEIGQTVESVARVSCEEAAQLEKQLIMENGDTIQDNL